MGKGVRISMIRVEHMIYPWHDLSLVRLPRSCTIAQLRFYLVHWSWNWSSPSVACESLHNPRLAVDSRINNWSWGIFKPGRLFENELYWITGPQRWFEQIVLLSVFDYQNRLINTTDDVDCPRAIVFDWNVIRQPNNLQSSHLYISIWGSSLVNTKTSLQAFVFPSPRTPDFLMSLPLLTPPTQGKK